MLKKIFNISAACLFFLLAFLSVAVYLRWEFADVFMKPEAKIILMGIACVFAYLSARFSGRDLSEKRRSSLIRLSVTFAFVVYSVLLVNFLFLEPSFGRSPDLIFLHDKATVAEYLDQYLNLEPGSMILRYTHGFFAGLVSFERFFMNVIGNILLFMPFALFLPVLFEAQRKFLCFFLTVTSLSLLAEVLQVLLLTGTGDVDDVILNSAGACFFFLILRTPLGKKFVKQIES